MAPGNVEFRGGRWPDQIPELLSRARALVVPSQCADAAPKVVLEAYASGVPVLANAVGGLPELVQGGVSGLLVGDGQEVASWREAIDWTADDGESERLGAGAFELWQARYSPDRALENLLAAYEAAGQMRSAVPSR
jgi:glycosyltransferase involved in cell wall biosynthesis